MDINKPFAIILDPGHGEETIGKRGRVWEDGSQAIEYKINRILSKKISEKLTSLGYANMNIFFTVDDDHDLPLYARVQKANDIVKRYGSTQSVYLSIHFDAFNKETARGWSCFVYRKAADKSRLLASIFYETIEQEIKDNSFPIPLRKYTKTVPYGESGFYVLRKTNCPAVLSENGFMTNRDDCRFFLTDEGMEKLADIHINSIVKFIQKK